MEIFERLAEQPDLWETLQCTGKTVVLYGMGNGADKILQVCAAKGIAVREVFASDGFVRGQSFHGMPVRRWSDLRAQYGAENLTVLLGFGSSRPEVLETVSRLCGETEVLVPDVPVFGEGLFDRPFFTAHLPELRAVRALLSDDRSRAVFDGISEAKLTGSLPALLDARDDADEVLETFLAGRNIRTAGDFGAYTGDTVRDLLDRCPTLETVYAMEPDARNFARLERFAAAETRARVVPVRAAAWNTETELPFDASGNRNASASLNRSGALSGHPAKVVRLAALPPDLVFGNDRADYLKYDVEGSEEEAILGSRRLISESLPRLSVSLYHRVGDLFSLPLLIHRLFPAYRGFFLRRPGGGFPAWDLNLYVTKESAQ